jgi:biotin carboxyl carrier protein
MPNDPKKGIDPTEAALSAIQAALRVSDNREEAATSPEPTAAETASTADQDLAVRFEAASRRPKTAQAQATAPIAPLTDDDQGIKSESRLSARTAAVPHHVLMPALAPTMKKGNLAKWLKKEGDVVKTGDVIAEIETDKATMEIEAIDDGRISKILVPEGTSDVTVNTPIATILTEGENRAAPLRDKFTSDSVFEALGQLALLELALLVGLVAAFGTHVTESWKIVFVALGTLSLGFGAAVLMYRRMSNSRMSMLEHDYMRLKKRANILIRQVEQFERQSYPERKAATR